MSDLLKHLGYHKKWHASIQSWRKRISFSINENIIQNIFNSININKGNFVEFGAWDGIKNANSRNLFLNGWSGLYIESDLNRFDELKKIYKNEDRIYTSNIFVNTTTNLLDSIINNTINDEIHFMSIDIDGLDLEIFKSINIFLPIVVCIEGGQILEPYHNTVSNDIAKNNIQQSLHEMNLIFKSKGYVLLCSYQDSFFIKKEYANKFKIDDDIFNLYIDGLIAYPRIPYIKSLLDNNNLENRIINFIIKDINKKEIDSLAKYGSVEQKSEWIDNNYNHIKKKLLELKKIRTIYPYDKYNERLWKQVSTD